MTSRLVLPIISQINKGNLILNLCSNVFRYLKYILFWKWRSLYGRLVSCFHMKGIKRKVATFNQTQSVNFPLTIKILILTTVVKPILLFALKLSQGKKEHKFSPSCLPSSNITAAQIPAFQSAVPDTEAFLSSTHLLSLCLWFFVGVNGGFPPSTPVKAK